MNQLIAKFAAGSAFFLACGAASAQYVSCPSNYDEQAGDSSYMVCNLRKLSDDWSSKQAAVQTTLSNYGTNIVAANTAISAMQSDRAKLTDLNDLNKLVANLTVTAARLDKKITEAQDQLAALEKRVEALKPPVLAPTEN